MQCLAPLFFVAVCIFLALWQFAKLPKKPRPRVFSAEIVKGELRNVKEWNKVK